MFKKMKNYIQCSREERRAHIKLEEACIEIGGYDSREYRGLLAHYLGTEIPTHEDTKILLCHACNNAKCSNPKHLYWGTPKENTKDSIDAGTWKSIYDRTISKYGEEKAKKMLKCGSSKAGKTNKGRVLLSKNEIEIYKNTIQKYLPIARGDIKKICEELKISHTHVRRLINKYGDVAPM